MKKILVIGGNGFVGTNLLKKLKINTESSEIFSGDLNENNSDNNFLIDVTKPSSFDCIANKGINVLINLAAVHRDDVRPLTKYDDVNVGGAENVCNAARKYNINTIIFTSSVAIYGFAPPNTKESGEPNYFNDYGRTKYQAEQVYKKWQSEDKSNRKLVIIRPTVIFGEGNRGNVYNLLNQIASSKFIMFGAGKNKKSMAYVENVVSFIDYSLSFKPGLHIYNYIDKPDLDMNNLVSKVRLSLFKKNNVGIRLPAFIGISIGYIADFLSMLIGKSLPVSSIRVKKFLATTQFDSSICQTDFVAPFSLNDALSKTVRYEFIDDNSDKPIFETE
ncbi:NAD-dependent epimerase/dehydratase family protein [Acinetobacter sp.]|uniref:NAD-dependent epimerase/dehydratase family protein n=1 Tax=Acinetobacter sp. TaxID=472 RepID=UPI000C4FF66A|nr:NAD-dependent epimerase/dehydratase family protein [Acinetobacter sp.]MBC69412.1 UDP-N-acetylglucosamine 4-epimerase [Acinetobacter sp.]